MTTLCSKPSQITSDLGLEEDGQASRLNEFDTELIDKIKIAITKLKTTTCEKKKTRPRTEKFPCSICDKNCNSNQDAIFCTHCTSWVHRKCNAMSKEEYAKLSSEPDDAPFQCFLCVIKENSEIFPLLLLDKSERLDLYGVDLPSQLKLLDSYELRSKLANMPNLQDFDMDENLIHKVNSKYYDIVSFPQIRTTRDSFSLFHANLRSLSAHLDELQLLLTALKMKFDIIGISETKEQAHGFLNNVNFNGYIIHSQHSKCSAGGVALYVKSTLDYMLRDDLSVIENEYETLWVEIKNSKSQNVLCCCAYRHPNTDVKKFNEYVDQTMNKISKENKLIFLIGDFNINLLNYNSHNETNDFLNTMLSHYLLPHILHPTRVTDHSATVIDNIFSNNSSYETISGNIMTQISDHFPQFLMLNKITIDYKSCSCAKRDYSNFDEQRFVHGFSSLNMNFLHDSNRSLNSKFDVFYKMCLHMWIIMSL